MKGLFAPGLKGLLALLPRTCVLLGFSLSLGPLVPAAGLPGPGPVRASESRSPAPAAQPARGSELFRTGDLFAKAGLIQAGGNLAGIWDPSPALGFFWRSSYYGPYKAETGFRYALLDGADAPVSVHHGLIRVSLLRESGHPVLPDPAAGLDLHFIRAQEVKRRERPYYFLEENESEFGLHLGLRKRFALSRARSARPRFEIGGDYELILSRPEPTSLFAFSLGLRLGGTGL